MLSVTLTSLYLVFVQMCYSIATPEEHLVTSETMQFSARREHRFLCGRWFQSVCARLVSCLEFCVMADINSLVLIKNINAVCLSHV